MTDDETLGDPENITGKYNNPIPCPELLPEGGGA